MEIETVWVFNGDGTSLPSAIFRELGPAEAWIKQYLLSGILTEYPLDRGVYDWVVQKGYFKPKYASQQSPAFIGSFSSAYLQHFHYENGSRAGQ